MQESEHAQLAVKNTIKWLGKGKTIAMVTCNICVKALIHFDNKYSKRVNDPVKTIKTFYQMFEESKLLSVKFYTVATAYLIK